MKIPFSEVFADETKNGTKLKTSDYQTSGSYPIIDQGQDFIAGYTDAKNGLYTDVPAIVFGDHTRILKYVDFPFFLGADGAKILKARANHANYKYLYYALKCVRIPDTGYNRHFKWLKEATVSIPDSRKQESIVYTLDTISRIIAHRQSQLAKLDELVKCRFVELFGDPIQNKQIYKLHSFTEFAYIDAEMTTDYHKYANYPHIGIDSIEKETGRLIGYRTVAQDGVISGKYLFSPEHLIYSKIRPNLNKVACPDFHGVCSADSYPIRNKSNCNKYYLLYVLRSQWFLDYIVPLSSRTNLPKVNRKQIESFTWPLPPIELQNQFEAFVRRIDRLRFVIRQSLDETQKLFDSLMQEYFD